jgi:hypothetical protein
MNANANSNSADLDSLLDMDLDDLADLPEFKVFPAGAHRCIMKLEKKMIGTHPAWELGLKLQETLELTDAAEVAPEAGTESSVAYMMDNEFGQGKFKELVKPLAAHYGVTKVAEVVEQSNGAEVVVVTKVRQNKEKTQSYLDIVSIEVV